MEIVTVGYNHDLDWLDRTGLPINVGKKKGCHDIKWPKKYTVYELENVGLDALPLLTYIVDRYDTLPDRVVHLHGHFHNHHHRIGDVVPFIMDPPDADYIGLNGNLRIMHIDWDVHWRQNYKTREMAKIVLGYDPGNCIMAFDGNAQFIVKKELILRHSKEHYQRLIEFVSDPNTVLEALDELWYMFFSGKTIYEPPIKTVIDMGFIDPTAIQVLADTQPDSELGRLAKSILGR
jgi:hypothetical protein